MDISNEVCGDCVVLPMCKDFCRRYVEWADQWISDAKKDLNSPRMLYLKSIDVKAYTALKDFVEKRDGVCITHSRTNKLLIYDNTGHSTIIKRI